MNLDHLDQESNLLNLGATSIDMIRIVNLLDRELGFRPKMDAFYSSPTVAGLVELFHMHRRDHGLQTYDGRSMGQSPIRDPQSAIHQRLLDPVERDAFKQGQPGLRHLDTDGLRIPLPAPDLDDELKQQYTGRSSQRQFGLKPISLGQFGRLLSCLRQISLENGPKYRYGSAGGLYPVQTYLYLKRGRVQSLSGGIYYHHPVSHQLVLLSAETALDRGIYDPLINRPIYDEAAFALFLVARLSAIVPMYGEQSLHFATLEAGAMTQLLETSAAACGLGLCQIGAVEFERVRDRLALEATDVLVHSLLGGPLNDPEAGAVIPESHRDAATLTRMLARIQQLSPEEKKSLLDAQRSARGGAEPA
jgi:SagB-type dehydrogenase family enzyme